MKIFLFLFSLLFFSSTFSLERVIGDNEARIFRNGAYTCTGANEDPSWIIVGVHEDLGQLLCSGVFSDTFTLGNTTGTLYYMGDERVDQGINAYNQYTIRSGPHAGLKMHRCQDNEVITGINIPENKFLCGKLDNVIGYLIVDGDDEYPTQRGIMHACPRGFALIGAHFDLNIFLCGQLSYCQDNYHCPEGMTCVGKDPSRGKFHGACE